MIRYNGLLFGLLLIVSCSKDNFNEEIASSSPPSFNDTRSTTATVENGMLSVDFPATAIDIMDNLRSLEATQAQREQLYLQLGITPQMRELQNYTDNPACLQFEQDMGYTSSRSVEENEVFTALDEGDENISSIITGEYYKTLLNENGAIKIGNRIYKHYESGLIALVTNGDFATYNDIEALTEDPVHNGYNYKLMGAEDDIDEYWVLDAENNITDIKYVQDFRLSVMDHADGSRSVSNHSFIETPNGEPVYHWTYEDGSSSTGKEPDRVFTTDEYVSVTCVDPSNPLDTIVPDTVIDVRDNELRAHCYPEFTSLRLTPTLYLFQMVYFHEFGPRRWRNRWELSNGDVFQNTTAITYQHNQNEDNCDLEVELHLSKWDRPQWNCVADTLIDFCHCTIRRDEDDKQFKWINGRDWRLDVKIWIESGIGGWFLTGEVGSRSKTLRKSVFGFWRAKSADHICAFIEGHYRRQADNCDIVNVAPKWDCEDDSGNVQRNIGDNRRARRDDEEGYIWSKHSCIIDGVDLVYTKNGGFLFL